MDHLTKFGDFTIIYHIFMIVLIVSSLVKINKHNLDVISSIRHSEFAIMVQRFKKKKNLNYDRNELLNLASQCAVVIFSAKNSVK